MISFIGVSQNNKEITLYFLQQEGENVFFKTVPSRDGFTFDTTQRGNYIFVFDRLRQEEQTYDWHSLRIAKVGSEYLLTYKSRGEKGPLLSAFSIDGATWQKIGEVQGVSSTGAVIPNFEHKGAAVMYSGEKDLTVSYSKDLITWNQEKVALPFRDGFFDSEALEVANAYIHEDKILLTYYVKKQTADGLRFLVGAAYFDKHDPAKLLWRADDPIYQLPESLYKDTITPLGSAILNNQLLTYWKVNEDTLFSVSCPLPVITTVPKKKVFSILVRKFHKNPIIAPRPEVAWESRATFNSAAIYEDGKVHFLYRALGDTDLSVLGYATSTDGLTIDYRSDMPAYIPREPFETPGNNAFSSLAQHFVSGGGYGGVEDPRITKVEDTIYLTYVAFDGATPPRAAISSISVEDFVKNNWDKWAKPKLISAPGMVNKSAVVLPKKVRGKYVVMHRVYPNILVDYLDDLEFNEYLRGDYFIPPRKNYWDSKKVGAGAPPMETKDGWLLIYQSVGYQDPHRYKIGAMMLDKEHPEKVLYRTSIPLIEPVEPYENNGFKAGVVYPCGAVIMDKKLHIYYGGADSYVNAASADLDTFLDEMKHHQEPKVKILSGSSFA